MKKQYKFDPDWVSPPGDTIADILKEKNWSEADLAKWLSWSLPDVKRLIQGSIPLDDATAKSLWLLFGPSENFWKKREAHYQSECIRLGKKVGS